MRLVLKRGISAELARIIAPPMVDVYRWMDPMTVSVIKGLKGMDEYVQVCLFVSFFLLIFPYPRIRWNKPLLFVTESDSSPQN